jgi:hypothetical protein
MITIIISINNIIIINVDNTSSECVASNSNVYSFVCVAYNNNVVPNNNVTTYVCVTSFVCMAGIACCIVCMCGP